MAKFEKVTKYADVDIAMPAIKTAHSAGYDMVAAEDTIIPSWLAMNKNIAEAFPVPEDSYIDLNAMAQLTKTSGFRPTLVSTGMKCDLDEGTYLELSVRSSSPLKYGLMLANGVGIIDKDYYNNPDNEGEIFFQLINLTPYNLIIKKGEAIGQAIIHHYYTVEGENTTAARTGGFGSTGV